LDAYFRRRVEVQNRAHTRIRLANFTRQYVPQLDDFTDSSGSDSIIPPIAVEAVAGFIDNRDPTTCLEVLCKFTSHEDFCFHESLPSLFFSRLIDCLRNFSAHLPTAHLCLALLGNMWQHYDVTFPLLSDPELVDVVWQLCLHSEPELEVRALEALLRLSCSHFEATRECCSPSSIAELLCALAASSTQKIQ
jgi:hypothetical protein